LLTETGDAAGTLTVKTSSGKVPPLAATAFVEVHVTVVVPEQLQPDPLKLESV